MPRVLALLSILLAAPALVPAQEITRTAGRLRITVETKDAYPGGLLVMRLRQARGVAFGILDGRRIPFFNTSRGPRALVPIPVTFPAGPVSVGVEVRSARGRSRVALTIPIRPRTYAPRVLEVPEPKRALLTQASSVRDGRLLLLNLRTVTDEQLWRGPFKAPVSTPAVPTFGAPEAHGLGTPVEGRMDSIHGEYHRGLDYPAPAGTTVFSPAAGIVRLAGPLNLSGDTVVVDHGQGLLSVFFHLSGIEARAGEHVYAGQRLGLSGDSGIAASPHLHWGVYLHAVAIDPRVVQELRD